MVIFLLNISAPYELGFSFSEGDNICFSVLHTSHYKNAARVVFLSFPQVSFLVFSYCPLQFEIKSYSLIFLLFAFLLYCLSWLLLAIVPGGDY